ncbi:hypothetical protein FQZ97_1051090 [compost metagenome]
MRQAARARRDALLRDWPEDIPGCAPMPPVEAGLHLCVRVDSLARERELVSQARAVGVEMNGLGEYWLEDSEEPVDNRAGLVLGFAAVPEERIAEAVRALRGAWGLS